MSNFLPNKNSGHAHLQNCPKFHHQNFDSIFLSSLKYEKVLISWFNIDLQKFTCEPILTPEEED